MVVKIFYAVIAIFSIAMVFLASSDPYFAENFKKDLSVANMQANDIVDYEINATMISARYEADELNRYNKEDEFLMFKSEILRGNLLHFLSSDKAKIQGDNIKFIHNVVYDNNDSLNFQSDEVVYNQKTKIAISKKDFIMTQNSDKIIGKSLEYDLKNKQTKIKGIKAWIEQER